MAAGVEHAAQSMIHVAPPADTAATRQPPRMNHEARQKCCRMQASLNRAVCLYKIRGVQIARPCREVVMGTDCHRHHIHPDRCPPGIVNKQLLLATDKKWRADAEMFIEPQPCSSNTLRTKSDFKGRGVIPFRGMGYGHSRFRIGLRKQSAPGVAATDNIRIGETPRRFYKTGKPLCRIVDIIVAKQSERRCSRTYGKITVARHARRAVAQHPYIAPARQRARHRS